MAEILVKAIDATHVDPIKDRQGCYKCGDPVVVFDDGHAWGNEECPPKFVIVKVPGTAEEVKHLIEPWQHRVQVEELALDEVNNILQLRLYVDPEHVKDDGTNAVSQEELDPVISKWNVAVNVVATDAAAAEIAAGKEIAVEGGMGAVLVGGGIEIAPEPVKDISGIYADVDIFQAACSPAVLGLADVADVVFTKELESEAGTIRILADWSAKIDVKIGEEPVLDDKGKPVVDEFDQPVMQDILSSVDKKDVEAKLQSTGAVVNMGAVGQTRYTIKRDDVVKSVKEELTMKLSKTYARRRFCFNPEDIAKTLDAKDVVVGQVPEIDMETKEPTGNMLDVKRDYILLIDSIDSEKVINKVK